MNDLQINGTIVNCTASPAEVQNKLMEIAQELGGMWTGAVQPGR